MAEEFQGEVCGGSWWNSPRTSFMMNNFYGASGCWQNDFMMNMKTIRSSSSSSSTDDQSTLLLAGGCAAAISPDSAFQMMASSSPPSSTTTNCWNNNNQATLLVNGRNEESYNQTLPEISASNNQNSSNFVMDQQQTSNFMTSTGECTGNLVSTSYGYPSNLLQTFFDNTSTTPPEQDQQPLYDDFHANLNDFNPVSSMSGFSSIVKPKQQVLEGLQLANKTPFWSVSAVDSNNSSQADYYTSTQSRYLPLTNEEKPNCLNTKSQNEDVTNLGSLLKKSVGEPTFKRPRLETPSPLPTFKVRKEKLGDRVTALQQLVSPFGKTDTASVLHEAIDYIKLLHDQVNVLSAPYMKNGATTQRQQIQDKIKNVVTEGAKQQDLRSRGLCLVPVSSTFPVATETAPDYWTSGFGSTFK